MGPHGAYQNSRPAAERPNRSGPGDFAFLDLVQERLVANLQYLRGFAAVPVHSAERARDERALGSHGRLPGDGRERVVGRVGRASQARRRLVVGGWLSCRLEPPQVAPRLLRPWLRVPAATIGSGALLAARRMLCSISAIAICSSWRITGRLMVF
jgi:hypothetical protein